MGCDIHVLVEKKHGDEWVCVNTLTYFTPQASARAAVRHAFPAATSRNYERFSRLAGVRGEGPEPKGVPEDASQTARYLIEDYGEDGHSHSFLPVKDAAPIFLETEWFGPDVHTYEYAAKYPADFFFNVQPDDVDNCRLVFWFDN